MRTSHPRKLLSVLGVGLSTVVLMLAIVTWGPHLARDYLAARVGSAIGRGVTIGAIEVSPFRARLRVKDVVVAGQGAAQEPLLTIPEGTATIDVSEALFGRLHILDAHLSSPKVRIVRLEEQSRFSFQDMLDHMKRRATQGEEPSGFVLEKASLEGGSFALQDQVVAHQLNLADIRATVSGVSTRPDHSDQPMEGEATFSLAGGTGEVSLQGVPFGSQTRLQGRLEASKVSLATFAPYFALPGPLSVTGGTLALDIRVQYAGETLGKAPGAPSSSAPQASAAEADRGPSSGQAPAMNASADPAAAASGAWSVTGGSLRISQATLAAEDEPIASVQEISAEGLRIDPRSRQVSADGIRLADSSLEVTRDHKDFLLIEQWLPVSGTDGESAADRSERKKQPTHSLGAEHRWQYTLGALDVADLEVRFIDLGVPADSRLPPFMVNLQTGSLSTDLSQMVPLKASVALEGGSQASFEGLISPSPLKVDGHVKSNSFDVTYLEPYFGPFVNVDLVSGTLSASGDLEAKTDTALNLTRVVYVGELVAKDVKAVDQVLKTDLLRWSAVEVPSVTVDWQPAIPAESHVEIGEMAVADFYGRVILDRNGKLNLEHVLVRSDRALTEAPDKEEAKTVPGGNPAGLDQGESAARPDVWIGKLRLARGQLNFTDNFVNPHYTADLTQLSGSVTGISSSRPDAAEVAIHGFVNGDAPLEIQGHLNLLAARPVLDLKATAQGVELTQLTPYAIRWAGYAIESGTLSADVRYRIKGSELAAENRLVLHHFRLGDEVKSESASNLPLKLALSILRDPDGTVTLNLPISGSLSDPEFSLPGLAGQAIAGLIRKAATAPFALLASLGDRSDSSSDPDPLNFIAFAAGRAEIPDRQHARLQNLAQMLRERPELNLEVIGYAGRSTDVDALRHELNRDSITDADLLMLARRRGVTLRDALAEAGVAEDRLTLLAPRFADRQSSLPPSRAELEIPVPHRSDLQDAG